MTRLGNWLLPTGRIGVRGYWLYYLIPVSLLLASLGSDHRVVRATWDAAGSGLGVAAVWLLLTGNLKRLRDLNQSASTVGCAWIGSVGLLGVLIFGAMALAFVAAIPKLVIGVFTAMSSGQAGYNRGSSMIEEAMSTLDFPVIFFLVINAVPILILGVKPGETFREARSGEPTRQGTDAPEGMDPRLATGAGALALVVVLAYTGWVVAANRQPPLIRAIAALDASEVTALLEDGADPNERIIETTLEDPPGETALGFAAGLDGSPEADSIVAALVQHGAGPGGLPLYRAARYGRLEALELMIEAVGQARAGPLGPGQLDSLVVAGIEGGHPAVVRLLFQTGADHGRTFARALSWGCWDCVGLPRHDQDTAIVRAFLEQGPDPNEVYSFYDRSGLALRGTPLMLALGRSEYTGNADWQPDVIRLLLDAGADPTVRSPSCYQCKDTPQREARAINPGDVVGGESVYREVMDMLAATGRN